ncbi:MAG: Yip1 family protein [Hyphomicrobiaceae bacterium]
MQQYVGDRRAGRGLPAPNVGNVDHWAEVPEPSRDWRKLVLIIGLGVLSWVATYVGMLELIEANMGDLPILHKVIIGFSVGMLMTMIIWLLDQLFAPLPAFTKLLYVVGYVFLTMISVGFGFGFYWKVLESRSEASRSAESAVTQVQSALHGASVRLDQLTSTLEQLAALSRHKAELERTNGTSCPNSRPGDGPRRKLRDDDANRFGFAADLVKSRAGSIKTDMHGLDGDLRKIVKADPSTINPATGTRNDFMNALSRKLDLTVTGFNAFRTDPQLRQIRADLDDRAGRTTFPDSRGGTFACPDPQLSAALKGVVRAIDQLPIVEKPKIAAVEGAEATIEAFRRLGASFYGMLTLKMPPSADEQRELQKKAVQTIENPQLASRLAASAEMQAGLSKRDYVPLAIAIFVDLCLLLVSMGRPINRLNALVPRMREAEQGPVIHILSRFSEIHRDQGMRQSFEVLRHVVFDYFGAYYVAVPLDAPFTETRTEQMLDPRTRKPHLVRHHVPLSPAKREELRIEAHLIANLFASFERDGVFKRVMWLNVAAARKQLHRQGSKFADAEAFRIYRFNDGAWSQIILGAVMGAARRVEARRRSDPQLGAEREPSLDSLFDRMRQAEEEAVREPYFPRPKPVYDGQSAIKDMPADEPRDDLFARFGPYAAHARNERMGTRRRQADADTEEAGEATSAESHHGFADAIEHADAAEPVRHHAEALDTPPRDPAVNVLPFKNQPRGMTDTERSDDQMPNIIARSLKSALMAADAQATGDGDLEADARPHHSRLQPQHGHATAEPAGDVTVTASERKLTFSLPMNDRLNSTLFGFVGTAARTAAADAQTRAQEQQERHENAIVSLPNAAATAIAPARPGIHALPPLIDEHKERG